MEWVGGDTTENLTPGAIWGYILAAASAIVLLCNAAEKIALAVKSAKAPVEKRDNEIEAIKQDISDIKKKLETDKQRLDDSANSNHVTQKALLALLEHGLHGNNVDQMTAAKKELETYLINH